MNNKAISTGQIGALAVGGAVPLFVLPAVGGANSGPGSLKSKYNMVILFVDGASASGDYLQALANIYPDVLAEQARALAVVSVPPGSPPWTPGSSLPYQVLTDDGGATTRRMLGDEPPYGLCVADRFGQVFCLETALGVEQLPPVQTILDWLLFVQIQCPE